MGLEYGKNDNSFILNFLDFGGGLNTRDLDTIIRDNELSDVANFNFDKRGALKVRPGFTKFSNTALSTVSSIIADSYSESNRNDYDTLSDAIDTHYHKIGQSITGDGGILDSAIFYIKKVGSPTGNAFAKIYAHSGTFGTSSIPTGDALATSDALDVSTLSTGYALSTFSFSGANKITLVNGTKYVVTIEYSAGLKDVNFVSVEEDSTGTHAGNACGYRTSSGWVIWSAYDLCFYVYSIIENSDFGVKSVGGYYKVGEDMEVIATGSTVISKVTSTSKTDIKTELTGDGLMFDLHQYMNHYYMANGEDPVQVYDGTNDVWDIGYPIPTSNCTAAKDDETAGGLEAKLYKYKITYYYSDGESNCCTDVTSITPTVSKSVALTSIPIGGERVTQRKIYRTTGDGSTYKLLTTLNDNEDTDYTDSIADSGLGADMDTDNDAPPVLHYVVNHKGRLWGMGDPNHPSRVYYSKALHPESFPPLYWWDVGKDDGTIGMGLSINLGMLAIFKNYSTWIISGDTPTGTSPDMELINANPRVGLASFMTMAHAGNDLIFLSPNLGVQRLHRVILATTETMDTEALSGKIDTTIEGLAGGYLQYACAEVFDHKYHLYVPDGVSQTSNNIALALDLRGLDPTREDTIRWTKYTGMNFASCALIYDTSGDRLLCGTNADTGYLYDFGVGTTDDGVLIEAYATTKNHDMNSFINDKTLRSMAIYGRASEDWEFSIRLFTNSRGTITQTIYEFGPEAFVQGEDVLWDTFLFDKFMWDGNPGYTNIVTDFLKPHLLTQSKVNLLKLKIENVSANQSFAIYGACIKGFIGNQYLYD